MHATDSPRAAIWSTQTSASQLRPGSSSSAGLECAESRCVKLGAARRVVALRCCEFDEEVEGVRIGHGRAVGRLVRRYAHENAAYRYLHLLSGQGARDGRNLVDPVRHVPRRILAPQPVANLALQSLIENDAGRELDEQGHE